MFSRPFLLQMVLAVASFEFRTKRYFLASLCFECTLHHLQYFLGRSCARRASDSCATIIDAPHLLHAIFIN